MTNEQIWRLIGTIILILVILTCIVVLNDKGVFD